MLRWRVINNNNMIHLFVDRDLAKLLGFSSENIQQFSESRGSPTQTMLQEWANCDTMKPTVGTLWEHLSTLQRYDVMDDCMGSIGKFISLQQLN